MIKAGIFDIGGVVHKDIRAISFKDMAKTLRMDQETLRLARKGLINELILGKITEQEFWKRFKKDTNINDLDTDSLFLKTFSSHYSVNEDVLGLVKLLKSKDYKVAVLSDTIKPHADYQAKLGIYKNFDVVILSYQVGLRKPDPRIFKLVLNKLDVKPHEAFFVDDLKENIDEADRLGINGILFKNSEELTDKLKLLGVNT